MYLHFSISVAFSVEPATFFTLSVLHFWWWFQWALTDCGAGSGELLLDQGRFQDAVDKFEEAIRLEKEKYVLPPHSSLFPVPSPDSNSSRLTDHPAQ